MPGSQFVSPDGNRLYVSVRTANSVAAYRINHAKKTLVPLGQGNVDSGYPRRLLKSGYTGPVNLHVEYLKPFSKENVPRQIAAIKRDAGTLRKWLGWA